MKAVSISVPYCHYTRQFRIGYRCCLHLLAISHLRCSPLVRTTITVSCVPQSSIVTHLACFALSNPESLAVHTSEGQFTDLCELPHSLRSFGTCAERLIVAGSMSPDAATLPSPPDFAPWDNASRPHSLGGMYSTKGQISSPGPYQNGSPARTGLRQPRFPNIKDLQDEAMSLDVSEGTSVRLDWDASAWAKDS